MTRFKFMAIAILMIGIAACGGKTIPDPEPETSTVDGSGSTDGMGDDTWGDGSDVPFGQDEGEGEGELAMVIYFDFDQSEVRPADQATLERHANRLANQPGASIRLEGHADERGSREYNIGLGERRAQAVRKILLIQGASAAQLSTVSFGEERPAAFGSDEESYAQNRRVEIRFLE